MTQRIIVGRRIEGPPLAGRLAHHRRIASDAVGSEIQLVVPDTLGIALVAENPAQQFRQRHVRSLRLSRFDPAGEVDAPTPVALALARLDPFTIV